MGKRFAFEFSLDEKAALFFEKSEERVRQASDNVVEATGMFWSDTAKTITRDDGHIDTGLYVNSIGYKTEFSSKDGVSLVDADGYVIHQKERDGDIVELQVGSSVEYADDLEKKYNIMARALDQTKEEMPKIAKKIIAKTLFE